MLRKNDFNCILELQRAQKSKVKEEPKRCRLGHYTRAAERSSFALESRKWIQEDLDQSVIKALSGIRSCDNSEQLASVAAALPTQELHRFLLFPDSERGLPV